MFTNGGDDTSTYTSKDWEVLLNDYSYCKRRLQSKKASLLVVSQDLERASRERDHYKRLLRKLIDMCKCPTAKEFATHFRGVDEMGGVRTGEVDKLNGRIRDLEKDLSDAVGDIKLLRQTITRQRLGDDTTQRGLSNQGREELVQQLEELISERNSIQRDLEESMDCKNELIEERDHLKEKADRLNKELNYVLGGDDRRIVDVDAVSVENKYVKERLKQNEEERNRLHNQLKKYREVLEKKKSARLGMALPKLGSSNVITQRQVQHFLAGDGGSSTIPVTSRTVSDLQALSSSLLETVNDKNLALAHQKNTNKILGHRVSELEKKLKTVETAGLWNVNRGCCADSRENLVRPISPIPLRDETLSPECNPSSPEYIPSCNSPEYIPSSEPSLPLETTVSDPNPKLVDVDDFPNNDVTPDDVDSELIEDEGVRSLLDNISQSGSLTTLQSLIT